MSDLCLFCNQPIEPPGKIICIVCNGERCRNCCKGGYQKGADGVYYSVRLCDSCTPDQFKHFVLKELGHIAAE